MRMDVTFLGLVRRVVGAKVLVEISPDIPSASPIINGRLYRLGQVGSFVRIPLGFLNLYGIVSMVGVSEVVLPDQTDFRLPHGQRWVEVQLVGESYMGEGFNRGISIFPTIDDEVHVVAEDDLAIIYGSSASSMLKIGTHASSENLSATIDLDKLVTRHAAILGSTGSGKSNTVAGLLRALGSGSYPSACVLVIDPHGEYSSALEGKARIFSIGDKNFPLIVPYWALSFDELGWFLFDRRSVSENIADTTLRNKILDEKRKFCKNLKAGPLSETGVKVDSPVPFNLKKILYELYTTEHATLWEKDNWDQIAYQMNELGNEMKGDIDKVIPPRFSPPGAGSSKPFKSSRATGSVMVSYLNKIYGRLQDTRFDFLLNPNDYDGCSKDLDDLVNEWINHENSITVLDLGGVPSEVIDLVVGVVTRILFETMFWGRDLPGIGRQRPLLIVYEEAHIYLPKGGAEQFISGYSRKAVRRIFKEGRKYGIGAIVISQRPSELDETILSQCGTFFALRLSNSEDQGRVKSTVPDSLAGLTDLLPVLRTGEALVLGEAVQIPSRIRLPLIEPRPNSGDPEPVKCWLQKRTSDAGYAKSITAWRQQRYIRGKGGD
jgi:DNA helicase HerA-like ATPase